ncbi:hypothetical protein HDU97_005345 [Phlyctochytrium planicorne]|nr:hypothetical protein HDU97_005345 [Phlyctochytrium planicorne]
MPTVVSEIIDRWRDLHPGFTVTIVTPETVTLQNSFPVPKNFFKRHMMARRSHWARLAILMEHGGVWMDAGVALTGVGEGLEGILRKAWEVEEREAVVFLDKTRTMRAAKKRSKERETKQPPHPLGLDTFFIGSVPRGSFVTAWLAEFNLAFSNFHCESFYLAFLLKSMGSKAYDLVFAGREWDIEGDLTLSVSGEKVLVFEHDMMEPLLLDSVLVSDRLRWEFDGDESELARRLFLPSKDCLPTEHRANSCQGGMILMRRTSMGWS